MGFGAFDAAEGGIFLLNHSSETIQRFLMVFGDSRECGCSCCDSICKR